MVTALPTTTVDLVGLRPALLRLDLQLRLAIGEFRDDLIERARDPFRGLYISEAEIDELLAQTPVTERVESRPPEVSTRLTHLARLHDLDTFEQDALLICLAPEMSLHYERLYAYLQDDATKRRPTVDLVLRLLCPVMEERDGRRGQLGPRQPTDSRGTAVTQ